MKFSIIVPVFNREKTISKCLDSLISQNVNKEILIIDNCSIDKTKTICLNYMQKYDCIKYYYTNVKGVSHARNIGLDNATGDILCFCDSDDYYEDGILSKVDETFANNKIDVLECRVKIVKNKDSIILKSYESGNYNDEEYFKKNYFYNESITLCNKFYSNKIFDGIRLNEKLIAGEDANVIFKILLSKKVKIKVIDDVSYNYVMHGNNSVFNDSYRFDEEGNYNFIKSIEDVKASVITNQQNTRCLNSLICRSGIQTIVSLNKTNIRSILLIKHIYNNYYDFILSNYSTVVKTKESIKYILWKLNLYKAKTN